ncbi:MAG: PEP-CTERM sorting domain-containing protein [Armatimonadota bacterium]
MRIFTLLAGVFVLGSVAMAQLVETENNGTKATANSGSIIPGGTITGTATGTDLDYFNVGLGSSAPAIYLNTFSLASTTTGHTVSLRGLFTDNGGLPIAGGDVSLQVGAVAESGTARINRFYTFGAATNISYRVSGTSATTAAYTTTWTQTAVTPTVISGTFNPGAYTFKDTGTAFAELWLYDANFNPVKGNLSDSTFSNAAQLNVNLGAGTYYLFSGFDRVANNQAIAADDFRAANDVYTSVTDSAGVLAQATGTQNANLNFSMASPGNSLLNLTRTNGSLKYTGSWSSFTVVPEPASMAVLGLGILGLARRRRSSK